jgi:hypothetical protein
MVSIKNGRGSADKELHATYRNNVRQSMSTLLSIMASAVNREDLKRTLSNTTTTTDRQEAAKHTTTTSGSSCSLTRSSVFCKACGRIAVGGRGSSRPAEDFVKAAQQKRADQKKADRQEAAKHEDDGEPNGGGVQEG